MPLPDRSQVWPPKHLEKPYLFLQMWHAWFASDTDALSRMYGTTGQVALGGTSVWGQIKRWFWGSPTPSTASQRPNKLHVDIAARVARMSSALLFSQMPEVKFPEPDGDKDADDTTSPKPVTAIALATERLLDLLDDNAHARLLEGGQYSSAQGGAYLRVSWDQVIVPDGPFLTVVRPDCAVPEFRWGRLVAVTFWSQLETPDDESGIYTLLERHEVGTIEFGLYWSGKKGELGGRRPLAEHSATAYLGSVVNSASSVETGSTLLTAQYFPNILPNPMWDNDPIASNLGRSDFDGAEPLMDALDEAYTSWMRDIRLGKARILVPKGYITSLGAGQGGMFNADQEVFVETGEQIGSLNPNATSGNVSSFMEMFQPNIRWEEHQRTVEDLIGQIYESCGYSTSTFGEAGDVAMTATESQNREKLTVLTRSSKILYTRPPLRMLLGALMDVDEHVFSGPGRAGLLPDIEFADAAAENPLTLAQTLQALAIAEAVSTYTKVQMLHEDWDEEQINEEVALIHDQTATAPMMDPSFPPFGANDGNAPAEPV